MGVLISTLLSRSRRPGSSGVPPVPATSAAMSAISGQATHATFTPLDLGGVFKPTRLTATAKMPGFAGLRSGPRHPRRGDVIDWRAEHDVQGGHRQSFTIVFNAYYDLGHWGACCHIGGLAVICPRRCQ